MIDLAPHHLETVRRILKEHVPACEVRAFGSRVDWTAKDYSDLDLAVMGSGTLKTGVLGRLKEAFEECDLPFRVDVLDWHATSPEFKKVIEKQYEVIQGAKGDNATDGWTVAPLEDCMAAIIDYRGKTPQKTSFGVALITAKVVKGGRIAPPDEFIAEADYEIWMRRGLPQAGDIVITTEAPLGEVGQLGGERVALAQRLITLRGKPGVLDNTFLKFLMQAEDVQEQMRARSSGTTVLGIKQSELRKVLLTIPSFPEQRVIAHILGTLDDKIELNGRMNETLEAMARAIFKSWFVDFDPVRAKAEGRDPGLPKPLADLFPDSFEESARGEIPQGWRIAPLPEVIGVNPTRTLGRGAIAPYLDMANMPTQCHSPDVVVERAFSSGTRFINGDTLMARITPCLENGKTAYVDFLRDCQVGWGSTEYIVFRPKPPLPTEYAYCLARSSEFREFAIQSMTGSSGRQRVPVDSLSDFAIASPSEDVAVQFGRLVTPLFARARAAAEEGRVLAALRDTLLPKLISGELRIKPSASRGGVAPSFRAAFAVRGKVQREVPG